MRGPVTSIDRSQPQKIHFIHKASFPTVKIILPRQFSYLKDSLKIRPVGHSFSSHIEDKKLGQQIIINNTQGGLFTFGLSFATKTGSLRVQVTDEDGEPIRKFRKTHGILRWKWKKNIRTPEGEKRPGVQVWIKDLLTGQILDLNPSAKEAKAFKLPPTGMRTFSVPSGRYLVLAGTTVQIDSGGHQIDGYFIEETTDVKYKVGRRTTPIPCGWHHLLNGGRDEKGLYEIYESEPMVGSNNRWKCIHYKRYTYKIFNSTVTSVGPDEKDKAYIQLPHSPKLLAGFSESLNKQLIVAKKEVKDQLKEEYKNYTKEQRTAVIAEAFSEETASTVLSQVFVRLPRAGASTYGPSMLASEATNLVYLTAFSPETELDEEFLARFMSGVGISVASWIAYAKVGAVVGSAIATPGAGTVAGAAAGFAVGFVGDVVVNRVMKELDKAKIRKKVAKAVFDDIKATVHYDTNNNPEKIRILLEAGFLQEPEIISTPTPCKGVTYGLHSTVLSKRGKDQKLKAVKGTQTISLKVSGMPTHWRQQATNVCLQGDITILHGARELEDLRWPLDELLYQPITELSD